MNKYEASFVLVPNLEDEKRNGVIERFKELVEKGKGNIEKVDEWGLRKLAYTVKNFTEGYYVFINFQGEAGIVDEINRIAKITDEVLRHMVIKENE
ncbi:30S ribosomal protein S6 [Thermohalobacter berrensis]|uniref:Small ribosomal subunit protein bS6 n=1 Tax=Thermohalobacter berrensis TaxID=99594 RepID=A0A419T3E7_9FIRM|nr:30S ribosomal protein S6 [Thermohalobacter berrensis]RKD32070.1 30S ribosomal protein S6 [Thermohalobacter berrensis]